MDFLIALAEWIAPYKNLILFVCPPIVYMYIGYRIGTRGKFYELRRKV